MKRLLLVLIAGALFFGCGKGNKNQANTNLLIGKWYAVKDTVNNYVNNTLASQSTISYHTDANYVQFNADGSGSQYVSEVNPSYTETFTYSQGANNQLTLNYPTQIVSGGQQPASSRTGTIKTLTATSLVVTFNTTETVNGTTENTIETQYFSSN